METIKNHMNEFRLDEISFVESPMQELALGEVTKSRDGGVQQPSRAAAEGYIAMAQSIDRLAKRIDAMEQNQQQRELILARHAAPQTGSVGSPVDAAPRLGSTSASAELDRLAKERADADGMSFAKGYQKVIESDVGQQLWAQHRAQSAGMDEFGPEQLAKSMRGETPAHEELVQMAERFQAADPSGITFAKAYHLATRTAAGRRLLMLHFHQRGLMPMPA